MKRSTDRILTTHAGSLPRPQGASGLFAHDAPDNDLQQQLFAAVRGIVEAQNMHGVDIVNDGEFGKAVRSGTERGTWWSYIYSRIGGFEFRKTALGQGLAALAHSSKDRQEFSEFYTDQAKNLARNATGASIEGLVCTGPVHYTGNEFIKRDTESLERAVNGTAATEGFMSAVSPATLQILPNEHYASQEDYTLALAEAMRSEYEAIVDAGFVLQIDDPAIVDVYDWWYAAKEDVAGYRKWAASQIEVLNHALRNIPEDRIRYHICWGSWQGPHKSDIPLKEVVDLLLTVKAQGYVIEAGNVRHEHEWKVWRETRLPDGKLLIPGVVSHVTNVLEHPELIADRLVNFASAVGRENVIAGTDCGLGGRIHPQLAWAKLEALREGAELASRQLWRS